MGSVPITDANLADARIASARLDEGARVVTIEIVLASGEPATLVFEGVRPSPHLAGMLKMASPKAGNILDWAPSEGPGNTHIYLMDGVITIRAEKLSIRS
jgi:hypothetical protein